MHHQSAVALMAAVLTALTPAPTALHLVEDCDCPAWPQGTLDHTLITRNKAMVEPSNIATKMTIGGSLISMTDGYKTCGGQVTVGGHYDPYFEDQWDFAGKHEPLTKGLSDSFDWSDFEDLARKIVPGQYPAGQKDNKCDDYHVYVLTKSPPGGTLDLTSFQGENSDCTAQAQDDGKTLVVLNTSDSVTLISRGGQQFGPSVLAPFSTVILDENAGFMDGFLIAKNALLFGDKNEMHGDAYSGPLKCKCTGVRPGVTPMSSAASASPTASPTMSTVSGEADPHLVNVKSERFDLMQPGNHNFLVLPRGAEEEKVALRVRAQVTARGDVCEGKLYITGLNITGSWLGTVGQLFLSTSGEALNRSREVLGLSIASSSNMSLQDFLKAMPPTMVKARQPEAKEVQALNQHVTMLSVSLKFGPGVIMRVDWEHQKEKVGFSNWLKLSSWGLNRAQMKVGGLLGEDDHQSVMDLPQECSDMRRSSALRKPRTRRASGMVAATASMDMAGDVW